MWILIQFNVLINIQCLIQYSMNHSMFNAYWLFNKSFNVQWVIQRSMHICYLADHSLFNKPLNVQWAIKCSILIKYSTNHWMWFKVATLLGIRWAVLGMMVQFLSLWIKMVINLHHFLANLLLWKKISDSCLII